MQSADQMSPRRDTIATILPKDFSDFNTEESMERVKTFFKWKYNAIAEIIRLHRRQQGEGESVQLYADSLKQIVAHCAFTNLEYECRGRDIFVAGLHDDQMLQKLYEKEDLLT